jgi:predicted ATPase
MDRKGAPVDSEPITITRMKAKNFLSLENLDLDLERLTAFVGPNASGKSNIVDVLRFVSDVWKTGLDSAVMNRNGITAMRRWSSKGRPYDVDLGLTTANSELECHYQIVIGSQPYGEFTVKKEHFYAVHVPTGLKIEEYEIEDGGLTKPPLPRSTSEDLSLTLPSDAKMPSLSSQIRFPARSHFQSGIAAYTGRKGYGPGGRQSPFLVFRSFMRSMEFYNIFPDVVREPQRPGLSARLMQHGENIASVLRQMKRTKNPFFEDLRQSLGRVAPGVSDAEVAQVGRYLIIKLKHQDFGRLGANAQFDLSQESDGTVRLLGILVALYHDLSASVIGMEEPELNIHPGALGVLADILKEASRRTQIVVTTHSPDLMDRLNVENIRAVAFSNGATRAGSIAEHQKEAVRSGLFSAGELHRMEGLELADDTKPKKQKDKNQQRTLFD